MKLANKTRAGSAPDGKSRVYFTAHPEDYDLLDVIAGDILRQQDCAVYYDTEPGADYSRQELHANLERVQLLVFPVTEKLLKEDSRVLDVEYSYAIQNHIPVLPFMQRKGLKDSGLEEKTYYGQLAEAFNRTLREKFSRRKRKLSREAFRKLREGRKDRRPGTEPAEGRRTGAGTGMAGAGSCRLPVNGRRLKERGEGSARYQNLQMLNAYGEDPTEIPYEEKLRKFLASVLVSDALAERIRQAFDAYIFLSYRKKDREYANKLIKLIHQNEFCRDIAIWFDEFLVPGESFSRAIEEAMEKSSLFAFAITPNVLEEPNYVKDVEYVRARKAAEEKGKVIFPVELAPLKERQEEELREKFQGLTERVDAVGDMEGKWEHFSGELITAVQRAGIRLGKGSPEHNFLIGLAYLNGIDVERDSSRALELIENAAENGLQEAVSELVDMYSTGKGVSLDYRKAGVWQERKAGILREAFKNNQTEETGEAFIEALMELGDCRYGVRDLEGANAAYEEAEKTLWESWDLYTEKSTPIWYLAKYYSKVAQGMYTVGTLETAGRYAEKYGECARILGNTDMLWGKNLLLGNIRRRQGRWEEAEAEYREAYRLASDIHASYAAALKDPQITSDYFQVWAKREREGRHILISSCNMMGRINSEKGCYREALEYYGRMLETCLQLQEEEKSPRASEELALAYAKMGKTFIQLKRLEDAEEYMGKALLCYKDLYEKYGTMEVKRGLMLTYEKLGDICMERQDPDEAMRFYEKFYEMSMELYQQTSARAT